MAMAGTRVLAHHGKRPKEGDYGNHVAVIIRDVSGGSLFDDM